ncbi:MAG: hypothetical protein KAT65_24895 [Methanophagales archaeon]|nr:hypothetical protein [Methanophagales archaeon]
MEKIKEMDYASEYSMADMWGKLNEVIQVVNGQKCVEEEEPIYETLNHNEVLIISKSEEGCLVASNHFGNVELKRIKYPKEDGKD